MEKPARTKFVAENCYNRSYCWMWCGVECRKTPHSKVHWANTGPTWALSAPGHGGSHIGLMNLAIWDTMTLRSRQRTLPRWWRHRTCRQTRGIPPHPWRHGHQRCSSHHGNSGPSALAPPGWDNNTGWCGHRQSNVIKYNKCHKGIAKNHNHKDVSPTLPTSNPNWTKLVLAADSGPNTPTSQVNLWTSVSILSIQQKHCMALPDIPQRAPQVVGVWPWQQCHLPHRALPRRHSHPLPAISRFVLGMWNDLY